MISGETPIEHSLYLAHETLLAFSEPVDLTLDITVAQTSPPFIPDDQDWHVTWQRYVVDEAAEGRWQDIEPDVSSPPTRAAELLESGKVVFRISPERPALCREPLKRVAEKPIGFGRTYARLWSTYLSLPHIEALTLRVSIDRDEAPIDEAFFNSLLST